MNYTINFGAIKDSVFRFSAQKLITEQKENDILKTFLTEVREKPMLKIQYLIYRNLDEGFFKKTNLAERYINENLNLIKKYNWNEIIQEHKVLRKRYFPEEYILSGNKEKKDLYESIAILIESVTRPGFTAINKSEEAYDIVLTHLVTEKPAINEEVETEDTDMPNIFSWKYITQKAVNNFNSRYSHLSENEQNILKVLLQNEDEKKLHLDNLIKENFSLIEKAKMTLNEGTKTSLNKFEEKLRTINVLNSKNIDEDILNLEELKYTLSGN